jgi:hypothetical protein
MRIFFQAKLLLGLIALTLTGLWAVPASAQATRTWVSGVGDDVNPCSRTAPCKTFAGAISKTAAGGEINCLDPGGFGAVTITKAMTIDCHYTEGGLLAAGNGIVVNAGVNDVVFLRGLDIFGVNPPTNGVRFIAGGALHIEDSIIRRFNTSNSFGVSFQPSGAARLYVNNVTISDNGNAAGGGGVLVQPTGTGSAQLALHDVRILDNGSVGFRIIMTAGTGASGVVGTLDELTVSGNGDGIRVTASGTAPVAAVMITNSVVSDNSVRGLIADGGSARMRVGNTSITGNATGVMPANAGIINTYGNNRNDGNAADGAFTLPIIPQE